MQWRFILNPYEGDFDLYEVNVLGGTSPVTLFAWDSVTALWDDSTATWDQT